MHIIFQLLLYSILRLIHVNVVLIYSFETLCHFLLYKYMTVCFSILLSMGFEIASSFSLLGKNAAGNIVLHDLRERFPRLETQICSC